MACISSTDHFITYRSLAEEDDSDGDTNLTTDINDGQLEISSSSEDSEEDLHERSSESGDGEEVEDLAVASFSLPSVPIEEVPEPDEAGKFGLYLTLIRDSSS